MSRGWKHKQAAVFVAAFLLAGCQEDLHRGLAQRDANDIVAVLAANNLAARRVADGATFRVTVSSSDVGRALIILKSAGYPKESYRSIAEVFPADGLISTPFEQKTRLAFALSQELSRTISMIDGVTSARVHLVLPETDLRDRVVTKGSASVVVNLRKDVDGSEMSQKTRLIVANGVPGLTLKDVSISLFSPVADAARPRDASPGSRSEMELPKLQGEGELRRSNHLLFGVAALFVLIGAGLLWFPNRKTS
ncbi:MAG: type III secretion system inner membrane ring lipoprotein SctJ [Beijerinckiaceae bacterium]